MRATNAGTRRAKSKQPKVMAPRGRPFARKVGEYETLPEFYPGMHVTTVAIEHPFEGVDAPTVESRIAEGYVELDKKDGLPFIVPKGHKLMGIKHDEFKRRQDEMHDEYFELLNPPGQPQTKEEMEAVIQGQRTPVARAENLQTKPRITLAEAEANLRTSELQEQAMLQERMGDNP